MKTGIKKEIGLITMILLSLGLTTAQIKKNSLKLPKVEGYEIMKCDFHVHTVFSDGMVWPTARISEAYQEGLDAVALTEHVEYRPKLDEFVSKDHLKSYDVAKKSSEEMGVILIKGTEITRRMAPGHFNAIFIEDANVFESFVNKKDSRDGSTIGETLEAAKQQGAFVFWNHPWFQHPENRSEWQAVHEELYKKQLIAGVEVVNGNRYDPVILQWCLDKNLTILSNSDIHAPMVLAPGEYRSTTLVYAKERTAEAIKDALKQRRTVAYSKNCLYGDKQWVEPIIKQSLDVKLKPISDKRLILEVENVSGISYHMEVVETEGFKLDLNANPNYLDLDAQSVTAISVSAVKFERDKVYEIKLKVINAQVGADKPMQYSIKFQL